MIKTLCKVMLDVDGKSVFIKIKCLKLFHLNSKLKSYYFFIFQFLDVPISKFYSF